MPNYTTTRPGGDVLLANTMPQAEYMYGCTPTAAAMLLGYYDLYGYLGEDMSNLIDGNVALRSRGTDGNAYDMDAFDTVLGRATASREYVYRFYSRNDIPTTPEQEYGYSFESDGVTLKTDEWNCLADYLGTGQYWRGNENLSTMITYGSLEDIYRYDYNVPYRDGDNSWSVRYIYTSMLVGLDMYVQSRGYAMDYEITGVYEVDCAGGSFTFNDYKKEIDSGRPVLISIEGHSMIGYGYNASTWEIIFDDCYEADRRMVWDGTYYYSGAERKLQSITVIGFTMNSPADLSFETPARSSEKLILSGTFDAASTPDYCFADNPVYLNYTIANTGSKMSANFYSTVCVDGSNFSYYLIESIFAKSSSKVANLSLGYLSAGMHNVRVILDEINLVQESSEENNTAEAEILVLNPGTSIVTRTKYVGNGETVNDTYVQGGGTLTLNNGTAIDNILRGKVTSSFFGMGRTLYARANVNQGGCLAGNDIYGYGQVTVSGGGTLMNTNVHSNGSATVNSGGKITGHLWIDNNATVTFYDGGVLDFNLSGISPDNISRVNDLSLIHGAPLYTLTVGGTQAAGWYRLASGASGFGGTISVANTSGESLGTLEVGQTVSLGGMDCTLNLTDGTLSVELVASAVPEPDSLFFAGDFNGDGTDMLAKQSGNTVAVYMNAEPWGLGVTLEDGWDAVGVGDFNGDKRDDFLRVNGDGYVVGEMSNGNGTFSPQVLNLKNAGWDILGTGDFDGNGADDVLIANPTGASETVGLLGYWESGATWTLINGYSAEWEMVAAGDFDSDGKCDMLWRNSFTGDDGLTYNAYCTWIVDNTVDWRMISVANPDEWDFLCAGDFDGNGSGDIVMIDGEGVVGIWGVNDGYLSSWSILSAVDTSAWSLAGVGDFNGDGTDDIAWCSNETHLAGYWQIEDKTLTSWQNIASIA